MSKANKLAKWTKILHLKLMLDLMLHILNTTSIITCNDHIIHITQQEHCDNVCTEQRVSGLEDSPRSQPKVLQYENTKTML